MNAALVKDLRLREPWDAEMPTSAMVSWEVESHVAMVRHQLLAMAPSAIRHLPGNEAGAATEDLLLSVSRRT